MNNQKDAAAIPEGLRILIVDDDEDIRESFSDILSAVGVNTLTATDGFVALNKLNEAKKNKCNFDLCIVDFKMPDMLGTELLARIRELFPELPSIMVTGYSNDPCILKSEDYGTWKVLQKPVDLQQLLGLIAELCDR